MGSVQFNPAINQRYATQSPAMSVQPTPPNGISPQVQEVLANAKRQLELQSPNGQMDQMQGLMLATTLFNLQNGTQFIETPYTSLLGGLYGPLNPHRYDPAWQQRQVSFQQKQAN